MFVVEMYASLEARVEKTYIYTWYSVKRDHARNYIYMLRTAEHSYMFSPGILRWESAWRNPKGSNGNMATGIPSYLDQRAAFEHFVDWLVFT